LTVEFLWLSQYCNVFNTCVNYMWGAKIHFSFIWIIWHVYFYWVFWNFTRKKTCLCLHDAVANCVFKTFLSFSVSGIFWYLFFLLVLLLCFVIIV